MDVGIRDLKAHLSEYIRRVDAGERITVTRRGAPVARLVGLSGASMVSRGISEGWITPPSGAGLEPVAPAEASVTTAEALEEDRG